MLRGIAHHSLLHADNEISKRFKFFRTRSVERSLLAVFMDWPVNFNNERRLVT